MKNPKYPSLKLNSKVILFFENKKDTIKHNDPTDTTTGTITLTGMGVSFINSKGRR